MSEKKSLLITTNASSNGIHVCYLQENMPAIDPKPVDPETEMSLLYFT